MLCGKGTSQKLQGYCRQLPADIVLYGISNILADEKPFAAVQGHATLQGAPIKKQSPKTSLFSDSFAYCKMLRSVLVLCSVQFSSVQTRRDENEMGWDESMHIPEGISIGSAVI